MAQIIVERHVPIKMRDGTILRGDVYRPAEGGPFPILLSRLPYNKSHAWVAASVILNPLNAADRGYAVVIQDCRGRFKSDGEWVPFHEDEDGYDTVEWCAQQPWANSKVGMYGSSYLGITAWQAIVANPPHLETAFIYLAPTNYHEGMIYTGGAFELGFCQWYAQYLSWNKVRRLPPERQTIARQRLIELASNPRAAHWHLPLDGIAAHQDVAQFYNDWLAHPNYDEYWQAVNVEEKLDKVTVPVLQMTGWFDNLLIGHLRSFKGIRDKGATEKARENQKLIVGPWTHENYVSMTMSKVGDFELGPAAVPNTEALALRWFDYWLKGINTGIMDEAPIRIFVTGANVWRDEWDWPLERAKETKLYLHSQGHANTLHGDGILLSVPANSEPSDTYVYDPAKPVPTVGGRALMFGAVSPGFYDQREVEERSDVLVYTSSLLMKDTEATGPIFLKLWAASSALDTDFTAKLVDVHPDGYAAILADGIMRVRYRESSSHPKLLEPEQIYELTIDLWAISHVFKTGHRIRVEVSSSNFPRFDRNLNTGSENASEVQTQIAIQTIYHDAKHPSHILLPIVE